MLHTMYLVRHNTAFTFFGDTCIYSSPTFFCSGAGFHRFHIQQDFPPTSLERVKRDLEFSLPGQSWVFQLSRQESPSLHLCGVSSAALCRTSPLFLSLFTFALSVFEIANIFAADSSEQDTLRRGFYQVWDAKAALEKGMSPSNVPEAPITLEHVLHCIEFLRQSVMCHADTTIEAKDEHLHGVVGFGILHACRNWAQMVKWVDDRNAMEIQRDN